MPALLPPPQFPRPPIGPDALLPILREWRLSSGGPIVFPGYIRFHDLRHTFVSHWVMNGGDLFKLQQILGHQSTQMTLRYAHLSPTAFAEDRRRFASPVVTEAERYVVDSKK